MILKRNLPFLLPFLIEAELQAQAYDSKVSTHISSIRQQIADNEEALTSMINNLTAEQMESLRISIEYLWSKSYIDVQKNSSCETFKVFKTLKVFY